MVVGSHRPPFLSSAWERECHGPVIEHFTMQRSNSTRFHERRHACVNYRKTYMKAEARQTIRRTRTVVRRGWQMEYPLHNLLPARCTTPTPFSRTAGLP